MKKNIYTIIFALMLSISFTACNKSESSKKDKLNVVCTIFPEYDWVREIIGLDNSDINLEVLVKGKVDLHSYQPSATDIMKVSTADVFIYIGGESDAWIHDVMKQSINKKMVKINLMEVLSSTIKEEEIIEGMQGEDEHEEEEDIHNHEVEYDEHIWLSLRNAEVACKYIANEIIKVDEKNKNVYEKNLNTYLDKLASLDLEYKNTVSGAKNNTLLVCDRFPFRYLVDDYNLNYYAAFIGCSAETEASFETIAFLTKKLNELQLSYIITTESAQPKIAETVIKNSNCKNTQIIKMNSLQAVSLDEAQNGATYISIMKDNLSVLQKALN
ncbi:MAG: zinc ABC transporter substrate-binding protein [Treponema sp.]|nr:zinc ABC transporter substrate-binding protein [Treponema sp.]